MSPSSESSKYAQGWSDLMKLVRNGHSWSGQERNRFFKNDGKGHFYEVSHLTGLDQAEDGRALALVDWDQDGRLDLWYRNRSAPRLRFMHNQHENVPALSIKLQGTTANRDGIGAVVEVFSEDTAQARLVRSVRAGDLFLSQSSKLLHFAAGKNSKEFTARVLWPGGTNEDFTDLPSHSQFLLKQGSGMAQKLPSRTALTIPISKELIPLRDTGEAQIILPARVPFPKINDLTLNGQAKLLILWSPKCEHCQKLIPHLKTHAADFKNAKLDVIPLSVETIEPNTATKLFQFQENLFDRTPSSTVPLAILLDRSNQALAIYRGPFSIPEILADWQSLRLATPAQLHHLAPPLKGTWFTNPLPPRDVYRMFPSSKKGR